MTKREQAKREQVLVSFQDAIEYFRSCDDHRRAWKKELASLHNNNMEAAVLRYAHEQSARAHACAKYAQGRMLLAACDMLYVK